MFVWGSISLIAYIVYHPLNALTFYRAGFPTFFNPIFLFSMTLLGVICTISYFKSGSLWLSAIIHWLVVVGWLIFFDGYRMLSKAN
jgi:predicted Abi (CAAX) family protease